MAAFLELLGASFDPRGAEKNKKNGDRDSGGCGLLRPPKSDQGTHHPLPGFGGCAPGLTAEDHSSIPIATVDKAWPLDGKNITHEKRVGAKAPGHLREV